MVWGLHTLFVLRPCVAGRPLDANVLESSNLYYVRFPVFSSSERATVFSINYSRQELGRLPLCRGDHLIYG